jgi:hypothetical protein
MRKTIPFILTASLLFGVLFSGSTAADDASVDQAVFYVQ